MLDHGTVGTKLDSGRQTLVVFLQEGRLIRRQGLLLALLERRRPGALTGCCGENWAKR
jgi:hypothetical protein